MQTVCCNTLMQHKTCLCTLQTPYAELQLNCNLWRNWLDIQSTWQSLSTIVEFWALASQRSKGFIEVAGPGSWNDPDMLIIGNEVSSCCIYPMFCPACKQWEAGTLRSFSLSR